MSAPKKKCRKRLLLYIASAPKVCKPRPREEGIDGGWEVIANALAWFESRTSLQFRRVHGARPLLLMGGWMVGWQVSHQYKRIKMQKYKSTKVRNYRNTKIQNEKKYAKITASSDGGISD